MVNNTNLVILLCLVTENVHLKIVCLCFATLNIIHVLFAGLLPIVPFNIRIIPPSSNNGSFTDCNLMSGLYHCNNHQLFNCSADTNQYYVWSSLESISIADFPNSLQQVKVFITYFVPNAASGVLLSFTLGNGSVESSSAFFVNIPANEQQLSVTFPPAESGQIINRIFVTLISGTIAINRIAFCSEPEG